MGSRLRPGADEAGLQASATVCGTRPAGIGDLDLLRTAGHGAEADEAHSPFTDLRQESGPFGSARGEAGVDEDDVEGFDEDRSHPQPVLTGSREIDEMVEVDTEIGDRGHGRFAEPDAGTPLLLPGRRSDRRQAAAQRQLTGDGDEFPARQTAATEQRREHRIHRMGWDLIEQRRSRGDPRLPAELFDDWCC